MIRILRKSLQFNDQGDGDKKPKKVQHEVGHDAEVPPIAFGNLLFLQRPQRSEVLDRRDSGQGHSKEDKEETE
jgi:hypothetical protein